MTSQIMLTLDAATRIFGKRMKDANGKPLTVRSTDHGRAIKARLTGNGNIIDVKDKEGNLVMSVVNPGEVLRKKIFNTNVTNGDAMRNPVINQLLVDAKAAEKAGNAQLASDLYNKYLNKTAFTFSVLSTDPLFNSESLTKGVTVTGIVEEVKTEKGAILSFEAGTVSVAPIAALASDDFNPFAATLAEPAPQAAPVMAAVPPPVMAGAPGLDLNQVRMYNGQPTTVANLRNSGWTDEQIEQFTTL